MFQWLWPNSHKLKLLKPRRPRQGPCQPSGRSEILQLSIPIRFFCHVRQTPLGAQLVRCFVFQWLHGLSIESLCQLQLCIVHGSLVWNDIRHNLYSARDYYHIRHRTSEYDTSDNGVLLFYKDILVSNNYTSTFRHIVFTMSLFVEKLLGLNPHSFSYCTRTSVRAWQNEQYAYMSY